MATKGASNRYGNTKGSNHQGRPTEHINYAWAKDFNRGGLDRHFNDHGKEFGCKSKEEYAAKALKFANQTIRIDQKMTDDAKKLIKLLGTGCI